MGKGFQRKTVKRFDAPGCGHFLTFSCFRNRRFLNSDRTRGWFLEALEAARKRHGFRLWGYVLMPDHAHLLVLPKAGTQIRTLLTAVKLPVARRAVCWVRECAPASLRQMADPQPNGKCTHRFWQRGGGYDRNIRSAREAHEELDYIHLNPIRRKLVSRLEDWPWSSWHAWHTGVEVPIRIDWESFPTLMPGD